MRIILSEQMQESIFQLVSHPRLRNEVLEVYEAAMALQKMHLQDNVALEDIVDGILRQVRGNTAIWFEPPRPSVKSSTITRSFDLFEGLNGYAYP